MNAQHTPGPYEIEQFFDRDNVIPGDIMIISPAGVVGRVHLHRGNKIVPQAEQEATARLWATAPKMLQALQTIHANAAESVQWIRRVTLPAIEEATGQVISGVAEVVETTEVDRLEMEKSVLTREIVRVSQVNAELLEALNCIVVTSVRGLNDALDKIDMIEVRDIARAALARATGADTAQKVDLESEQTEPDGSPADEAQDEAHANAPTPYDP